MTASGRVAVLASFMTDLTLRVARRPGPGETVVGSSFQRFLGGKGCNQAVAAARAGAATAVVGRLGDDEDGRAFLDLLRREAIDASHATLDPTEGTGVAVPIVDDAGENAIVIVPRANARVTVEQVETAAAVLEGADVLLLQLELPRAAVVAAAGRAKAAGAQVVLNPAPALGGLDDLAGLVDVVVPNEIEVAQLTGIADDPARAALELRRRVGASVVVTLGERGVLVLHGEVKELLAAHPVEVIDTVGAGDAFCGALGARLAAGDDLLVAARYANAAAALAVTVAGAEPSIPTTAQVEALLADTVPMA